MSWLITLAWGAQALLLITVAVLAVGAHTRLTALFPELALKAEERELVQFFVPMAVGIGIFTLNGMRAHFAWLRPTLARTYFRAWFVAILIGLYHYVMRPTNGVLVVVGVMGVMALANLSSRYRSENIITPKTARPDASDEAPLLRQVWLLQSAYYVGMGAFLFFLPDTALDAIYPDKGIDTSDQERTHLILGAAAAIHIATGMLSHHAAGAQTDHTWREYSRSFVLSQALSALAMIIEHRRADLDYPPFVLILMLVNVAFAITNFRVLRDRRAILRAIDSIRSALPLLWLLQAAVLFSASVLALVAPEAILQTLRPLIDETLPAHQWWLALDGIRFLAPLAFAAAGMSVLATLRRDRRTIVQYAGAFVTANAVAVVVELVSHDISVDTTYGVHYAGIALWAIVVALSATNLVVWLFPVWTTAEEQYQGAADTKPTWVYRLAVLQALLFGVVAAGMLVFPEVAVVALLMEEEHTVNNLAPVLVAVLRGGAPYWALMSAVSVLFVRAPYGWAWQGFCRWFAMWEIALAIVMVYSFDPTQYVTASLVVPLVLALLAVVQLVAAQAPLRISQIAGQPRPAGLLFSDLGPALPLLVSTLSRGRRAYHRRGVGATGSFEADLSPDLARPAFFEPGETGLLCTLRFSNQNDADDAALDDRGCALRLFRPETGAHLDLLLCTGAVAPVSNVIEAAFYRWSPERLRRSWLASDAHAREAAIAGRRRAPSSYADLEYHTQLVRMWMGTKPDGEAEVRPARLRLVPEVPSDTGIPDAEDEAHIWERTRRADETRPSDYLGAELAKRLEGGPVRLRLQVQLGPTSIGLVGAAEGATRWFDATQDWDPELAPWMDVGVVQVDRMLPEAATELLRFDPSKGGGVLATPRCVSLLDPRSLADAQDRIVRTVGAIRLWQARLRGSNEVGMHTMVLSARVVTREP